MVLEFRFEYAMESEGKYDNNMKGRERLNN